MAIHPAAVNPPSGILRGAVAHFNRPMFFLCLLAAALHYNHPDPLVWIAIYLLGGLCCLLAWIGRLPRPLAALVATALVGTALWNLPGVLRQGHLLQTEPGRETLGLLVVGFWLVLLAWLSEGRESSEVAPQNAE